MTDLDRMAKNKEDSENITKILLVAMAIVMLVAVAMAVINRNSPAPCEKTVEVTITPGDTVDNEITRLFPTGTDSNLVKAEITRLNPDRKKSLGDVSSWEKLTFPDPQICGDRYR